MMMDGVEKEDLKSLCGSDCFPMVCKAPFHPTVAVVVVVAPELITVGRIPSSGFQTKVGYQD
jgi:hypothetical protein